MSDAHRDEIAKLEALYAENPGGRIFTHLAEAYRKAGELDRAREVLGEGIQRHPDYSSAHVVLGRVLMDQGDLDSARSEFHRVLELDSHNLVAIRSLGDIARLEGDTDQALERYHQLLDMEPSDTEVKELVDELSEGLVVPGPEAEEEAGDDRGEVESPESADEIEGVESSELMEAADEAEEADWDLDETAAIEAGGLSDEVEESVDDAGTEEGTVGGEWSQVGDLESDDWSTEAPDVEADAWAGSDGEAEVGDEGAPDFAADLEAAEAALDVDVGEDAEQDHGAAADEEEEQQTAPVEAPGEVEDADVMTETIAQVYARQGLYDRAVEVYRELVRTRPDDEGLKERLTELEAEAARAEESEAGEPEADEPGAEEPVAREEPTEEVGAGPMEGLEIDDTEAVAAEAVDQDAGSPVEGLQTAELEAGEGADVAPLAGLEVDETDPETGLADGDALGEAALESGVEAEPEPAELAAESEGDAAETDEIDPWAAADEVEGLEGLETDETDEATEAWDAAFGGSEPEPEPAADAEGESGAPAAPWEAAPVSTPGEGEEADGGGVAETLEPVGETPPATEEVPVEAETDEADESPWTDEWDEEEAETPYAWAGSEEAEDGTAAIRDYLAGLLAFGEGAEAQAATGADSTAGGRDTAEETGSAEEIGSAEVTESTESAAPAESAGPAKPAGPASGDDDDDDLEMFRSWLESLKQ